MDLDENTFGDLLLVQTQLQLSEPVYQILYGHPAELTDMAIADTDIKRLFPQAVALAIRTFGASAIAGQQHPVLHFVEIAFHFGEKIIDPLYVFIAFPERLVLLFVEIDHRLVDGEVEFLGSFYELVLPPDDLLPLPG